MSAEDIPEFAVMIPSSRIFARPKKLHMATLNDLLDSAEKRLLGCRDKEVCQLGFGFQRQRGLPVGFRFSGILAGSLVFLSTVDLDQENTEDEGIERGQLGLNAESFSLVFLSTVDLDQENTEDEGIERGQLGLNAESCKFLGISAGDEVNIKVFVPPSKGLDLSHLRIEVDLLDGSSTHQPVLASNLVIEFVKTFKKQIFTEFQSILLRYGGNIYHCTVAEEKNSPAPKRGMLRKTTKVIVEVSSSMSGQVIGAEIIKSIFRDGFDMTSLEQELISLNIGGMTSQIREIVRLAFGSRMVSPATAKKLNLKHIKGMLLYGPPGSGKTLIARSICKLLNAKEPLIVRGPEITQELYGASERHIRALFDAAEKDEKQYGSKSDLHVIIFDEIDSIGKKRGAAAGSFQHDDKIVNQLLTMIDGTTELNNIFIIATTNRKDLLDEALLRLNLKHIKGMLLYGPPGSGKTLIARSICKLLNAKEPLIVRGPEITQELYGASERHIRALFDAAEKDEKQYGSKSDLHVIIFDEIDSIGKKRGAAAGSFQHDDKIVNQLLTMIDGTTELNNIFIIATTNRKDLLDEALLRDGRIELHIKIDYPDEQGRKQILDVCTRKWKQASLLDIDVDLQEIARRTIGYSGAALASLVTRSQSYANGEHPQLSSTDILEFLKVAHSLAKFKKKIEAHPLADLASFDEDKAKLSC
ncbi:unnamed protein product [Ilex paraguariensis]|uniref:Vesicle-fusing ATPase n=1 Tax=Ilex paraguariensis TaxID=185542 RepID=A0ABC8UK68_9AQUA